MHVTQAKSAGSQAATRGKQATAQHQWRRPTPCSRSPVFLTFTDLATILHAMGIFSRHGYLPHKHFKYLNGLNKKVTR